MGWESQTLDPQSLNRSHSRRHEHCQDMDGKNRKNKHTDPEQGWTCQDGSLVGSGRSGVGGWALVGGLEKAGGLQQQYLSYW